MADGQTSKKSMAPGVTDEAIRLLQHVTKSLGGGANASPAVLFPNGVNYLRVKLEVTGAGTVELEVSGQAKPAALLAETANLSRGELAPPVAAALPCQPENETAAKIAKTCDDVFDANKDDCNKFIKATSKPYFGDLFDGLDADGIIATLKDAANGWTLTKSISDTITSAQGGQFVIAGMTSGELGQSHGHLAVVVGCPGAMSGSVIVPLGYAGSLDNASARIRGERLSGTFPASSVRNEEVSYFSKAPTT